MKTITFKNTFKAVNKLNIKANELIITKRCEKIIFLPPANE